MPETYAADLAKQLSYVVGENRAPLPDWARYLIRLGGYVGGRSSHAPPLIAVVGLPIRAFAACFAGIGVVVRRAVDPTHGLTLEEHFSRLSSKGPGTPLTLTDGERILRGVLRGIEDRAGTRFLLVQITNEGGGSETRGVPLHYSYRVQLGTEAYELTERKRSQKATVLTPFLVDCLGDLLATKLVQRARTDCVIRGHASLLAPELTDQLFDVVAGRTGNLAQILRPKPLLSAAVPNRAVILGLRQSSPVIDAPEPPVLVFDGSLAFLKCNTGRPVVNTIVLLDRSEARFDDGLDAVLGLLRSTGARCQTPQALASRPRGMEGLFFEV